MTLPGAARAASVVLVVVVAAGCGEDGGSPAAEQPRTAPAARPKTTPYDVPAASKASIDRRGRKGHGRLTARRRQLVGSVAAAQLDLVGIGSSAITTERSARVVTITLSEDAACDVRNGMTSRLAAALQDALAFVEQVEIRVYNHPGSLAGYQRKNCRVAARVVTPRVIATSGRGSTTTAPIKIRTDRWVLSYKAGERQLRLRVLRGGSLIRQIVVPPRATGKRTIAGAGVYRIEVEAEGEWSVRARELR